MTKGAEPAAAVLRMKPIVGSAGRCARAGNGRVRQAPATRSMNFRRSTPESSRRRLEVRPYYAQGSVRPLRRGPVLPDNHQSTTALERNALRLQLAASCLTAATRLLTLAAPTAVPCPRQIFALRWFLPLSGNTRGVRGVLRRQHIETSAPLTRRRANGPQEDT